MVFQAARAWFSERFHRAIWLSRSPSISMRSSRIFRYFFVKARSLERRISAILRLTTRASASSIRLLARIRLS
jgi:hypothetical protein